MTEQEVLNAFISELTKPTEAGKAMSSPEVTAYCKMRAIEDDVANLIIHFNQFQTKWENEIEQIHQLGWHEPVNDMQEAEAFLNKVKAAIDDPHKDDGSDSWDRHCAFEKRRIFE